MMRLEQVKYSENPGMGRGITMKRLIRYVPTATAALLLLASVVAADPPPGHGQGQNLAVFGRLALEGSSPPLVGGTEPKTTILSLRGLGDIQISCVIDATPTTFGAFTVLNTTADPIIVSGFGTLLPGERTAGAVGFFFGTGAGSATTSNTFQVTSQFSDPDRIATVTVSGLTEGTTCLGHAHAIVQP
jgi:hypothetical protein